jgi:hypothetical protein
MVQILQREPGFEELAHWSHQTCFVADFARETAGQELSVDQIVRAFERHPARAKAALANGFEEPKSRGRHSAFGIRHSAFDDDSEGEILTWIKAQAEKYRSVTRIDIGHYYQTKYSRPVTRGWVDSFILRHGDGLA